MAVTLAGLIAIIGLMVITDRSSSQPGEISVGGSVTESTAANSAAEGDGSQTYGAQPPGDTTTDTSSADTSSEFVTADESGDPSEATTVDESGAASTDSIAETAEAQQDAGAEGDFGQGASAEGNEASTEDDDEASDEEAVTEEVVTEDEVQQEAGSGDAAPGVTLAEEAVVEETVVEDIGSETAEEPVLNETAPEETAPAPTTVVTRPRTSTNPSVFIYSERGNDSQTGQQAFFHESTPGAVTVLAELARGLGMDVTVGRDAGSNESAGYFTSCEQLKRFDVLVFVNTSGDDILNAAEREAMQCWSSDPNASPGFVGIHGTAESLGDWDYFNDLVGARFNGHAREQDGELYVNPPAGGHPSVSNVPTVSTRLQEEWYVFRNGGPDRVFSPWNPRNRSGLTVVLDVNEASYLARDYDYPLRGEENERMYYSAEIPGQPGTFGRNHPVAWYQEFSGDPRFGNTRSFYTSLGHGGIPAGNGVWSGYADAFMQNHLQGALRWAAGLD